MIDFAILCVCVTVGHIARVIAARPTSARLAAVEERDALEDVLEEAVVVGEDDEDPDPGGGEEVPEEKPALRLIGGQKR